VKAFLPTALTLLLLLASCHRRETEPPCLADTLAAASSPADATLPAAPTPPDSLPAAPATTVVYPVLTDTAARTNLRLFLRKQTTIYGTDLLIGEWQRNSEHEEYLPDGTGLHWDTSDDVQRDEAQRFQWTLDSNLLRLVFRTVTGAVVPKEYAVTFADHETLVYRDAYGDSYMWDRYTASQ